MATERKDDSATMTRQYQVSQEEVQAAWVAVQRAGGGPGYDGEEIADVEKVRKDKLYKIWNRLSSGSYMAQPVKLVDIPKVNGGKRTLGIPTVTDRVAQMVIKNRLEPLLEPHFHQDSYAYRPNRSAVQAVGVARERCFKYKWVVDMDIRGFFDALDHELLNSMLMMYTQEPMILLYVNRFLKANGIDEDGQEVERHQGTPQGGVVSPILANLYLHEAYDNWMQKCFPDIPFERYADDIIVHCVSEKQAYFMRNRIAGRLAKYKLTLHPDKTRIVYAGNDGRRDKVDRKTPRKFTYLGYDFKPRSWKGRTVYTPGMGIGARKLARDKMKRWRLRSRLSESIEDIAKPINRVIRGWIQYYGHYRRSDLYALANDIDMVLARWLQRKHNSVKSYNQAWGKLKQYKKRQPRLFCHWHMIGSVPTRAV